METKTRCDAWGADLPEKVQWDCYDLAKALQWPNGVVAQLEAIGIERLPTRASWYRFLARMRRADAARRIEKIAQSVAEAEGVADRSGIKDHIFVETLKALAIDKAMTGEMDDATRLAAAAASIRGAAQRDRELALKDAAQRTKDEALRLAREKFEFDAAKQAMAKAAEIKSISADDTLAADEKIAKVRAALFGVGT